MDSNSPTTTPPTGETVPYSEHALALAPGYILGEVPAGFEPDGVYEQVDQRRSEPPDGWFQLWAEPGSSRTSGRWFAIATTRSGYALGVAPADSTRISVNGRLGLLGTHRDGVSEIRVQLGTSSTDGRSVDVLGSGLTADEMQQVAGAIRWDDIDPAAEPMTVGRLEFDPSVDTVRQGMELLVSAPSECCDVRSQLAENGEVRRITYRSATPTGNNSYLAVSTRTGSDGTARLISLLEPSSPDPLAPTNPERTVQIGERTVTVTGDVFFDGSTEHVYNTARWTTDDETIVISGEVDLATLLDAVTHARPAGALEWRKLSRVSADDGTIVAASPLVPTARPVYRNVGKATLPDGSSWRLLMSVDPDMIRLVQDDGGGTGSSVSEEAFEVEPLGPVHEFVSSTSTVLVIALREPGAGTGVRVSVAGREPVIIPLAPIDDSGVYAAIDAFSELPPYMVELVDDAGTSLRLLTP